MAILTRQQMTGGWKPRFVDIEVPECGGSIRVQQLSVARGIEYGEAIAKHALAVGAYQEDQALPENERTGIAPVPHRDQDLMLILYSIVDESGEYQFTEADYDWISQNVAVPTWQRAALEITALNNPQGIPADERIDAKKKPSAKTTA